MTLLNLTGIVSGNWIEVQDESPLPDASHVLVSFERLKAEGSVLLDTAVRLGVRLAPHHDVEEIVHYVGSLSLIVIEFPVFTDGRGYSQAQRLRNEFGYGGELRAAGDILPDQARFLERCGFDSLLLAFGVDEKAVKNALRRYSYAYQPASDDVVTISKQRHGNGSERRAS